MAEIIRLDSRRRHTTTPPARTVAPKGVPLAALVPSWRLALEAANKSPKTIRSYIDSASMLIRFLDDAGRRSDAEGVEPAHIRSFLLAERERTSAASADVHFRNLRVFFGWLKSDGERRGENPVRPEDRPKVPAKVKSYLSEDQQRALLRVCQGNSFEDRRDLAIIRVLIDNGMRVSGLANIRLDGVDLSGRTLRIILKGGDELLAPIVPKTAAAIDRYLRIRAGHRCADSPWLWLGVRGKSVEHFTHEGVRRMLRRRGAQAGVAGVHPHRFRGTTAHGLLAAGVHPDAVMRIMGWRSEAMLKVYTSSLADERAREQHAQLSPGNRI